MGTRKREAWLSNAPERGTIAELVGLAVLVRRARRALINDNTDNLRGNQLPWSLKENIPLPLEGVLISPDGSNDRSAYDSSGNNRSNECEIRTLSKLSSIN